MTSLRGVKAKLWMMHRITTRLGKKLLGQARSLDMKLNLDKFVCRQRQVKFVECILTGQEHKPDPEKVAAIVNVPSPTDARSLRRFLAWRGQLSWKVYWRTHGDHWATRQLTKKQHYMNWTNGQETVFENIMLMQAPVVAYYDKHLPAMQQCNASKYTLGDVLMQKGCPVAYASRSPTAVEMNYV